jgi:hypothetical protein
MLKGQQFDIESEKVKGVKKLVEYYFDGCDVVDWSRTRYEFDFDGNAVREFNYTNRKLESKCQYDYNNRGLLLKIIRTVYRKELELLDTTFYSYEFDSIGRKKSTLISNGTSVLTLLYLDFDSANNAQTIIVSGKHFKTTYKKKFNQFNKPTEIETFEYDSLVRREEIKYNEFGDICYSYIPTLLDKSTGTMYRLIGGNRHSITETYEYKYDDLNRWTEKYVIYDDKRILAMKRLYKK